MSNKGVRSHMLCIPQQQLFVDAARDGIHSLGEKSPQSAIVVLIVSLSYQSRQVVVRYLKTWRVSKRTINIRSMEHIVNEA